MQSLVGLSLPNAVSIAAADRDRTKRLSSADGLGEMAFRVVNLSRGEIRAELANVKEALVLCDQLAQESDYRECFGVLAMMTVYETQIAMKDVKEQT